ncbi:MAG: rod shape-determining protein MreC [Odoribacteraceae bacterium]|nr:rod shape-determining protein MreC [Odoribacteraceae bacterium]
MKEIIKLIIKYHFTIVFIILEIICFGLIVRHNEYQRVIFSHQVASFTGSISSMTAYLKSYTRLDEINQELIAENVKLKNRIEQLEIVRRDTTWVEHSLEDSSVIYEYFEAKVVNITFNRMKNIVVLNKGNRHGIEREMAVATPAGVVGFVLSASEHYANVIPLINIESRVSAKLKHNSYYGSLQWDGKDYRYSYLKDIPRHVKITPGDTIITSGFSPIFPANLVVGYVEEIQEENGNFLKIKVRLAVDFKSMSDVYAIKNHRKEERKKLEEGYADE